MDNPELSGAVPERAAATFATTRWSVVIAAGHQQSQESTAALEYLCQTYWYPLYAHVRRRGYSKADAEDLTQAFFAHLFERQSIQRASPARGRFRSFLLAAMDYFLSDYRDRAAAQKRGGGCNVVSFDAAAAEERYKLEPMHEQSPDKMFDRGWALALVDRVLDQLKREFAATGKADQFARLFGFLTEGKDAGSYAEAASDLGQTPEAVRKSVERMRRRYGELFRIEIAHTVAHPEDADQEMRYLCQLASRPS